MMEDPPDMSTVPIPKRGGVHASHGAHIGGSALDKDYKQISRVTYKYARQKHNGKAISFHPLEL